MLEIAEVHRKQRRPQWDSASSVVAKTASLGEAGEVEGIQKGENDPLRLHTTTV
jgi:hypothetical protein